MNPIVKRTSKKFLPLMIGLVSLAITDKSGME
jgi:hypothetical protein